jgi:hypothetical protein
VRAAAKVRGTERFPPPSERRQRADEDGSELAAMEQLVERYQDELARGRPGSALRRRGDSASDVYRAVDEVYENQALYASAWTPRGGQRETPAYSDTKGQETQFDRVRAHAGWDTTCRVLTGAVVEQIALPNEHWEWVSDWRCDVHAHTDENGWVYAASWSALNDPAQPHRRCVAIPPLPLVKRDRLSQE